MTTIFAGTIEKRVMKVLKSKIAVAEKKHNDGCTEIDKRCDVEIKTAESRRETDKNALADTMVQELIGKFL